MRSTVRRAASPWILTFLLCLALLLPAGAAAADDGREVIFQDDFSGYTAAQPAEQNAELAKKWSVFSGHWFVKEGVLNQDDGGFDHGLMVKDLYLRCDYEIEAKVKLVSGGAGAGWYWNVFDQQTGDNGNMLRYDGNRPIMYGWMSGRGFLGTGGATGNLTADGKWHTMKLAVHNTAGTFAMYWDGQKIIDGAEHRHRSGYVGLECSLGCCQFGDVKVSVAKGIDWHNAPKGLVTPEWVSSLAVLPSGNIVYPVRNMHRVQIVSPEGKLIREFGEFGTGRGKFNLPSAVAVDAAGDIYVSEAGNNRVQVFTETGRSKAVIAPAGKDALRKPAGLLPVEAERSLTAAPDEAATAEVWVCDTGNRRVVRLTTDGMVVTAVGTLDNRPGLFKTPVGLCGYANKVYVADSSSTEVPSFDPPARQPLPHAPLSIAHNGKDTWAVAFAGGVATFDKDWKPLKEYHGAILGGIRPECAVFDKAGNILVADGWNHRIVVLPPSPADCQVEVANITQTSAVVSWTTDTPTPSRLSLIESPNGYKIPPATDYSKAKIFGDGTLEREHRVELTDLSPATRYMLAVDSPVKTIPATPHSIDQRFSTAPPEGKMAYTEVPVAVLCYANVTHQSQKGPDGKVPPPTTTQNESWLQHNIDVHEAVRYFYWTNSFFRLDLKFKCMLVTRPVDFAFLGSSSEEVYKDLATLAAKENLKPEDFGGVVVLGGNADYAYPWPTPWYGGKLTYTTGCCFAGYGDVWFTTHEFHRVTEGWMNMIGETRYTCADTPWRNPMPTGEHFDFLANTLRYIPAETYLNLGVGKVRVTADKDGDGVPDDDPNVVWDAKRAGADPNDRESYKNGLTNLQNLTAEIFHPAVKGHTHPFLTKQINLKYPFAVFDYTYERPMKTPTIDGKLREKEWDAFASTPNAITPPPPDTVLGKIWKPVPGADYRCQTYLNWDKDYLYFAAKTPFKPSFSVELDCNADGFFKGADNVKFAFDVPEDEAGFPAGSPMPAPGVMVWNNIEPVQQRGVPDWTNDRFNNKDKIKWTWGKTDDGWYLIEAALPRTEAVGLVPAPDKEMAICVQVSGPLPPTEKNPKARFSFQLFDLFEYGYFKLVDSPPTAAK